MRSNTKFGIMLFAPPPRTKNYKNPVSKQRDIAKKKYLQFDHKVEKDPNSKVDSNFVKRKLPIAAENEVTLNKFPADDKYRKWKR